MATAEKGKLEEIPRSKINRDSRLQMRKSLRPETVVRYGELISEGVSMPPAIVFYDGKHYWLADGWHRDAGCEKAGCETLYCEVRAGGFREAWLFALGANGDNGLPRDNDTIENVMRQAFGDEEVSQWTDRRIASHCSVSAMTVSRWRKKLAPKSGVTGVTPERRVGQDGKAYTVPAAKKETAVKAAPKSEPAWVETDEDKEPVFTAEDWVEAEAEDKAEKDNRREAFAYLKAAEKSLGALQTNCLEAKQRGAKFPAIDGYARGIYDAIQRGRASL